MRWLGMLSARRSLQLIDQRRAGICKRTKSRRATKAFHDMILRHMVGASRIGAARK
jgi:hypothetical protein